MCDGSLALWEDMKETYEESRNPFDKGSASKNCWHFWFEQRSPIELEDAQQLSPLRSLDTSPISYLLRASRVFR